jgi:Histidine kinase-, DNA gyrase B-, and HSP90-like ATPase/Domain of unknown function (DUF4405)
VLRNLLANALRHTSPGGSVAFTASPAGDDLEIAKADTGEGIAPEDVPHIFDPFWPAEPSRARDGRWAGATGLRLFLKSSKVLHSFFTTVCYPTSSHGSSVPGQRDCMRRMCNMSKRIVVSRQTRQNWLIDAAVFLGGVVAALSGIYFLFLPSGGYRGGRNPMYEVTILFDRHTWDAVHTWGGVAMMAAVAIHLAIHWPWVKMMGKRVVNTLLSKGSALSKGAKVNVAVDAAIALSFLACALSGLYFLLAPSGSQGGHNAAGDPGLLFSRTAWDLIHTWSGVTLISAATVHLAIHWRWVKNVTYRFFMSLLPQPKAGLASAPGQAAVTNSE